MKKYSEKTAAAVLNGVLKEARCYAREALWYSWCDADGRQCVVDGFRAFRMAAPVEGVPDMPEGMTPINLAAIYDMAQAGTMQELEAPDLADLDALIAYDRKCSSRERNLYMFGPGAPVVNAKYLRDALKVFPDARLFCRGTINGIVFKSEYGDGLLLPVRIAGDLSRERRKIVYNLATFAARFAV